MSEPIIRERMDFDILIVGAGPAGLCAAIRLAQLNKNLPKPLSICVLEKGAYVGAHILSGAVLEPDTLNELLPTWQDSLIDKITPVTQDEFWLLSAKRSFSLPILPSMHNQGNFIISLSQLCQWLANQAEGMGVNIFPGFPASRLLFDQKKVIGVQTQDSGLNKDNIPGPRFQPGIELYAKQILLAEGCRGSLTEEVIQIYQLRQIRQTDSSQSTAGRIDPQTYAIGVKELWEIESKNHVPGKVIHTIGWPLDQRTYGGSFIYHWGTNKIALGLVVGLDYQNPTLDPFAELQRLKQHPKIKSLLANGRCIEYGARALNEGGWQSIPNLTFPGGMILGCAAGFMNVAKIKGIHNALLSGKIAAETISQHYSRLEPGLEITEYRHQVKQSKIMRELYKVRNVRPGFHRGLWPGLINAAIDQLLFRGKAPWTFHYTPDYLSLKPIKAVKKIHYPDPDRKLTFDKLTQLTLSNTFHHENEPCHLKLKDASIAISINYEQFGSPEQFYCPAAVYEIVQENIQPKLQINFVNCLHCKACDIKDPTQNIIWMTPEGGDGPKYSQL